MKFQKTIVLTRLLVIKLMHESSLRLHTPHSYQIGQWVRFKGKLGQVAFISTLGVDVKFREENEITIRLIRPESFPSHHANRGIWPVNSPTPPTRAEYASNQLGQMIDAINLPLLTLASGVLLALLTLIY